MAARTTSPVGAVGLPGRLVRHSDLLVSGGAVLVVAMLVVPLPHWVLDGLLVVNVGLALCVLLTTAHTTHPLRFSVFPSLLLIMTLFRLAINVSATRLILLHAHAGAVIAAFGQFVVGGNYVVGLVVFVILVVIQFVVITNGAGRVAEVAARFTLDAMPGKQMAIDADLNAGLIDEAEARRRRAEVAREADFYGAMDGASKFVRGDAIAAVVMIIVNILGGFVIGLAQRGMGLATALRTYTLLTVGEGLVTQIPALIMATATGLIITRSSSAAPLGQELAHQLLADPRLVGLVAATLGALALIPGLPKLPFLAVAAGAGMMAGAMRQSQRASAAAAAEAPPRVAAPAEQALPIAAVDPVELEIGVELVPLADPAQGGDLLERITLMRRRLAEELGLVVPPVRVRDNLSLRGSQYAVKLFGARIALGEVRPGHVLVMSATGELPPAGAGLPGVDAVDPAFGTPARWVPEARRIEAEMAGHTVVDPGTVVLTHLQEVVKQHAAELLSLQDVRELVEQVRARAPAVVEELTPKALSLTEIHRVLTNLLRERVPIRDLTRILTTLAMHGPTVRDPEALTELVRQALARAITAQYAEAADPAGGGAPVLWVCALDPALEAQLLEQARSLAQGGEPASVPLGFSERLTRAVKRQGERMAALGHVPAVLCSPAARPLLRAVLERAAPGIAVISHAELVPEVRVRSVGLVTLDEMPADG